MKMEKSATKCFQIVDMKFHLVLGQFLHGNPAMPFGKFACIFKTGDF